MISTSSFIDRLTALGVDFFSGVPDSLLSSLSACIVDSFPKDRHIIAANEGAATALCAGYNLSTGRIGCTYMQNSGLGNAINPLLSLCDGQVYGIPVLLIIGWRGEPGVHDEPQHAKQGGVTLSLLDACEIPHEILSTGEEEALVQVERAVEFMKEQSRPYALVVRKGTFLKYESPLPGPSRGDEGLPLTREDAIRVILEHLAPSDAVVSTTGMASRELFELRESRHEGHGRDFLTVGSMGHASQIALSISLQKPHRRVVCLDGDGAAIMHMGSLAISGQNARGNFLHIVLNNGAHESVGGQPTVGLDIDLPKVASAVGYPQVKSVRTEEELSSALDLWRDAPGACFLEVKVRKGHRPDLGRPTATPTQNKQSFTAFLQQ